MFPKPSRKKRPQSRPSTTLAYLAVRLVVALAQSLPMRPVLRPGRRPRRRCSTGSTSRHRQVAMENLRARLRRPLRRRRARPDRPRRLPPLLPDGDGDAPHPPKLRPDDLAPAHHAGRPRAGARTPAQGRADDHAHRPLRQLGDGRLPVRRLRLPAALGRPDARQPLPRPLPPPLPRADRPEDDPQEAAAPTRCSTSSRTAACSRCSPTRTPASAACSSTSSAARPRPTRPSPCWRSSTTPPSSSAAPAASATTSATRSSVEEIIDPDPDQRLPRPLRDLTPRYTAALERLIRRDPTQYLWLHRRWKHRPPLNRPRPADTPAAA